MSTRETQLTAARTARDIAHAVFIDRLESIRADLSARGVGARVADSVMGGTTDALDAGLDVARQRKGLLAGTFAALLAWIFREPLFAGAVALVARLRGENEDDIEDEPSDQSE